MLNPADAVEATGIFRKADAFGYINVVLLYIKFRRQDCNSVFVQHDYRVLSASTMFILDARKAGRKPPMKPIRAEKSMAL